MSDCQRQYNNLKIIMIKNCWILIFFVFFGTAKQVSKWNDYMSQLRMIGRYDYSQKYMLIEYFGDSIENYNTPGAYIKQVPIFSLYKKFRLLNSKKQLVATATRRIWTFGYKFDITDQNDKIIGLICQPFLATLLLPETALKIYDQKEELIGRVEYTNKLGLFLKAELKDENTQIIGQIQSKVGQYNIYWAIKWLYSDISQDLKIMHMFLPAIIKQLYNQMHKNQTKYK